MQRTQLSADPFGPGDLRCDAGSAPGFSPGGLFALYSMVRIAQEVSHCHTRDVIAIHGRLQSRIYTKQTDDGPQERTAYEISALTAEIVEEDIY